MKLGKPNTMATKNIAPTTNANAIVASAAALFGELASVKFNLTSDPKTVAEMANRFMVAIRESAEARIAALTNTIKPATTAPAPKTTAKETKAAPKAKATPKAAPKTAPKAKETAKETEKEPEVLVSLSDKKAVKKLGLHFIPYSEKTTIIAGDTKPLRKELVKMNKIGIFPCSHLKAVNGFEGGFAWLVNNKHIAEVGKTLGIKVAAAK